VTGHKRAKAPPASSTLACVPSEDLRAPGESGSTIPPSRSGPATRPGAVLPSRWCREGRWIDGRLLNNKGKVIYRDSPRIAYKRRSAFEVMTGLEIPAL
jgi:hypothetical protein